MYTAITSDNTVVELIPNKTLGGADGWDWEVFDEDDYVLVIPGAEWHLLELACKAFSTILTQCPDVAEYLPELDYQETSPGVWNPVY